MKFWHHIQSSLRNWMLVNKIVNFVSNIKNLLPSNFIYSHSIPQMSMTVVVLRFHSHLQFNSTALIKRLIWNNQMTFYFLYHQHKTKCLFRNRIKVKLEASNRAVGAKTIEATISNKKTSGSKLLFQNELHKLLLCNVIHFTMLAYFFL